MKRRNFLQGLIAAPAVAKAVEFTPAEEIDKPEGWVSKIYEYGNFGAMYIEVSTETPKEYRATTYCPGNDWLNECEEIIEHKYPAYKSHAFSDLHKPFQVAIPVNELTKVDIFENDELIFSGMAEHDTGYIFKPFKVSDGLIRPSYREHDII